MPAVHGHGSTQLNFNPCRWFGDVCLFLLLLVCSVQLCLGAARLCFENIDFGPNRGKGQESMDSQF